MTRTLTHDQQQAAALYLGIPLATLQAVQEVEARSHGACPMAAQPFCLNATSCRQLKSHGLDADRLAQNYPIW